MQKKRIKAHKPDLLGEGGRYLFLDISMSDCILLGGPRGAEVEKIELMMSV